MSVPHSLLYLSQARAAAALMSAMARGDECVSLLCKPGISTAAVLDEAENELSSHGLRCVRVYGPASGKLSLRDLIVQIVARADPDAITDADLKAGFAALTEPGEGYDRVALLVTEAHNLLPSAMRYVQLACRCGPKLRIALAGQPGLTAVLAQDEFAFLRGRIARTLQLPGPAPGGAFRPSSVLASLRLVAAGPLVRSGAVAASALLAVAVGWRLALAPSGAAARADVAALGEAVAPIRAEPAAPAVAPSLAEPVPANAPVAGQADAPPGQDPAPPAQPDGNSASLAAPPERAAEAQPDAALPPRAFAAALPSPDILQARRPREGIERAATTAPAPPTRSAEERRCRDVVLQTQSGKDLSDADQTFLRDGCHAK